MKDVSGRELKVGQVVATTLHGYLDSLWLCKVIGFSPKKVRLLIEPKADVSPYTVTKFPEQVCIAKDIEE